MPAHPVASGAPFARGDGAAFAELARWYANADLLLRALAAAHPAAGPVACWPHHFDIATLMSFGGGREVGVGLSPGDHYYAQPYFYVNGHPVPDRSELPQLPAGRMWHRRDWTGAVLTGDALVAAGDQDAAAREFLEAAVGALSRLVDPRQG